MNNLEIFIEGVPDKYKNATLSNCSSVLQKLAVSWLEKPYSIFIYGNYGTGKTYFAFALIKALLQKYPKGIWPRYFTSPELDARFLMAMKTENGDREEMKYRQEEDVLFIDDLGREIKSERLKRQYFELLNYRYNHELSTILTSNFKIEQLGEIIDGSIASRMQEWQSFEFSGKDRRSE